MMGRAISRRGFLRNASGIGIAGLFGSPSTSAQQRKALPHVAYVYIFKEGPSAPFTQAFLARLRELGWVDEHNIRVDVRDAGGDPVKLDAIMRELVAGNVDVIATACTPEAKSAVKFTNTVPVVMAATGDPVGAGLAISFARPGGNVTGVSAMLLDQSAKRVEILKEAFPNVTRATVLWNPVRPDNRPEVAAMQSAARMLGVTLESREVRSATELADTIELLAGSGTQAILNAGDPLLSSQAHQLVAFATNERIPSLFENRQFVDEGGLMSFGPNFPTLHRRAADYVDKILKGAKPAELPIEQPSKFELVVNLKTAKALEFTIPQSLLLRADEVIR